MEQPGRHEPAPAPAPACRCPALGCQDIRTPQSPDNSLPPLKPNHHRSPPPHIRYSQYCTVPVYPALSKSLVLFLEPSYGESTCAFLASLVAFSLPPSLTFHFLSARLPVFPAAGRLDTPTPRIFRIISTLRTRRADGSLLLAPTAKP
jgi:hypothetical protein